LQKIREFKGLKLSSGQFSFKFKISKKQFQEFEKENTLFREKNIEEGFSDLQLF